jgi:CRISPR-associated protein Cmr2
VRYLVSIAIGPVQDFISTARRSRDLWFGSWLLSELSKAAALAVVQQNGTLVFPSASANELQPETALNVVNKIVAIFEANDDSVLYSLLEETIRDSVQTRLRMLRDQALTDVRSRRVNGKTALHWDEAEAQIDDLLEYYWAAHPLSEPHQYRTVRAQVEALLTARKNTRNFQDAGKWSQARVPKSSLDGLRESVIDEEAYDAVNTGKWPEQKLRLDFGVRPSERLCGIGLLKRRGNRGDQDSFFSTSHVAALPALERLNPAQKEYVEDYIRDLTGLLHIIEPREIRRELGHVPRNATLKPHEVFCSQDGSLLYDGRLIFEDRLPELWSDKRLPTYQQDLARARFCMRMGTTWVLSLTNRRQGGSSNTSASRPR